LLGHPHGQVVLIGDAEALVKFLVQEIVQDHLADIVEKSARKASSGCGYFSIEARRGSRSPS